MMNPVRNPNLGSYRERHQQRKTSSSAQFKATKTTSIGEVKPETTQQVGIGQAQAKPKMAPGPGVSALLG